MVFLDASRLMLTPKVAGTELRGKTPIRKSWDRHDRMSAISGVTTSLKRRRIELHFRLLRDDTDVRGADRIASLRQLPEQISGLMTIL
jgi:hypothetical protein